ARLARPRRLEAIERVESLFHLRFGYSRSTVAHPNHGLVAFTRRRHARVSAIFKGVVDEVGKAALQGARNGKNRNPRLTIQRDVLASIDRIGTDAGKQRIQVHTLHHATGSEARCKVKTFAN